MSTLRLGRAPQRGWGLWRLGLPVLGLLTGGCQGDGLTPTQPIDDAALYWELTLNHRAVTLSSAAPGYDTLTLVATPRNRHGVALAGLPQVQYTSRDLDRVVVRSEGVLLGLQPTSEPVPVVATLTVGNLKHIDSVLVRVVDAPAPLPVLDSFSAHPIPPDSAKFGAIRVGDAFATLPVQAADMGGTPLTDLLVSFRSSDPIVARIAEVTGRIRLPPHEVRLPGVVTFYASTTLFGVHKADTIPYRIGWPPFDIILLGLHDGVENSFLSAPELKVGVGAVVGWFGASSAPYDIVFRESEVAQVAAANLPPSPLVAFLTSGVCSAWQADCETGGNIVVTPPSIGALRRFPVPGTYEYHSTVLPGTGRIVVLAE